MSSIRIARIAACLLVVTLVASSPGLLAAQTPVAPESADQVALFAEFRAELTANGREVVGLFLSGDDEGLMARSSEGVQADLDNVSLETRLERLQTNRVRLGLFDAGVHLDGSFNGSTTMTGYYRDSSTGTFRLTADSEQTGDVPTGRWTGIIYPRELEFSVEFTGSADALAATLDIPALDIEATPVPSVTFTAEQPIGEVVREDALPIKPEARSYTAIHEWGDEYLVITAILDDEGTLVGLALRPVWERLPDLDADYVSDVQYRLPVDSQVLVYRGAGNSLAAYRAEFPSQRYSYDFVVWRNGSTYAGDGTRNEDYYVWGAPVVSPASGTVVAVENATPDSSPGEASSDEGQDGIHPAGNHVVIQVADGEYLFISHMQEGSVEVAVGDEISAGDPIGLAGNSGNSTEPHIQVHVQSTEDYYAPAGFGLPVLFSNYVVDGAREVSLGTPTQGHFVEPS
jgi:hypothetical protein